MGRSALAGDHLEDRYEIRDKPYNIKNTLTLRSTIRFISCLVHALDLPALTTLRGYINFRWFGYLIYDRKHTGLISNYYK